MTCRGGKKAPERRSGIEEDQKHPVMVQLAARWRRSNLVILAMLKKGNHPGKPYVRRGQRKTSHRRERDSLEGPHEEAEIRCKALRRKRNIAVSKDTCLEKRKKCGQR